GHCCSPLADPIGTKAAVRARRPTWPRPPGRARRPGLPAPAPGLLLIPARPAHRPVLQDPDVAVRTAEDDVDDRALVLLEAASVRERAVAERGAVLHRRVVVRRADVPLTLARVVADARQARLLHPRELEPIDDDRVTPRLAFQAEHELDFRDEGVQEPPPLEHGP